MVEKKFQDSVYRFTEPVRYFKANDPYYFEVDNIPIKQLEENCLWLKDQVTKTAQLVEETTTGEIFRSDIDELKPYSTGTDRVVRVKPGRFSARINDVSSKEKLQYLVKALGSAVGEIDQLQFTANNEGAFGGTGTSDSFNAKLQAALDKFRSIVSSNALGSTGLEERAFTWPILNEDTPINETGISNDENTLSNTLNYEGTNTPSLSNIPALVSQALLWAKTTGESESYTLSLYDDTNGYSKLPQIESLLSKNWRGITRFSIVDVPNELSIEVPTFDSNDFETINDVGSEVDTNGVQTRIDMVFLYAKPVDSSGVKIVNSGNLIQTITSPALGLIRGAGIKYSEEATSILDNTSPVDAYDSEGNTKILASPGDQFNENMGFTATSKNELIEDVRGSFPSPDDLLNIARLLSEKLEEDALELVGQSILPVAYIFVKQDSDNILSTDVVDIRPFFRTAELTYNERAGISAAVPQLSLANPAVGKAELQKEIYELKNNLTSFVNTTIDQNIANANIIYIPERVELDAPILKYKAEDSNVDSPVETLFFRDEIIAKEIALGKAQQETDVDLSLVESIDLSFVAAQGPVPDDYAKILWFIYAGNKLNPDKIVGKDTIYDANDLTLNQPAWSLWRQALGLANATTTKEASYRSMNLNSLSSKTQLLNTSIQQPVSDPPVEFGFQAQYLTLKHYRISDAADMNWACFIDGYTIKRKVSII
jgi:hypothetical protein